MKIVGNIAAPMVINIEKESSFVPGNESVKLKILATGMICPKR
jgi:hypothetical protein